MRVTMLQSRSASRCTALRRRASYGVVAFAAAGLSRCLAADGSVPQGHLQPFGGWKEGLPTEERNDVPEPQEFYEKYCSSDGGHGKPVVFRGAASHMEAMQFASDDVLLEKYGNERVEGVEYNLKETRAGGNVDGMNKMRDFLFEYNTSDIYMVSKVPNGMRKDISFLPCMRCGGYLKFLDTNNLWIGRGGSKSVIHYDDQDNINCMFAGKKRFILMHPRNKEQFEAHPNTKKNKFGWVDTDIDRSIPGYGAFMKLDVDAVDLIKHPGWSDVDWWYAELEAGDCLYIPFQWYHQVTAAPVKSINVHVWYWRPAKFDEASCNRADEAAPTFKDCTWGYEPRGGHFGKIEKQGKKPTKCKKKAKAEL